MYRILPFIHLFTVLLFSQEYYGKIVDLGEISEAGTDIIIYYEDDKVRAFLRNYTNMYGNKYFHLFGKGSVNDSSLELHSIVSSEGIYDDGGIFIFELNDNKLFSDRLPFVLIKNDSKSRKIMGNSVKKEDILFDASYFQKRTGRELILTKNKSLSSKMVDPKNRNNPLEIAVALFDDILPSNVIEKNFVKNVFEDHQYVIDNNYSGYTYKTCADDYDIEEDYDGNCKTYNFYRYNKQKGDVILVEVEIHSTCLDDSCSHEYHQLRFLKNVDFEWKLLSHKSGIRCDELRGGGSPPCL
tara:strand:+ start:470 stop:1363 length:894 start_codon:yes stop_codon:yes gene_type:complete